MIAVAVPDAQRFRYAGKQLGLSRSALVADFQVRTPIFAAFCFLDLAAERMCNPLHPVANPQYRNSQRKHPWVALWGTRVINRAWPAGQNDSRGLQLADLFERRCARQNGGEHLLFADAARNQLRILPAEIEDHHAAKFCLPPAFPLLLPLCR